VAFPDLKVCQTILFVRESIAVSVPEYFAPNAGGATLPDTTYMGGLLVFGSRLIGTSGIPSTIVFRRP